MRKSSGALALMNLLLALALLVLALAGARLYGRTLDICRENTRLRSAVGYIQSQVGAAGYSRVALRQGPEGVMLCIPEGASDYETRIFAWEGQLYSQFAAKDAAVDLSDSQALCELSAFSLTALCRAFEPLFNPGASVICMTYYGSQKKIPNYNVMGVAKAALESSVRYLASDLGEKNVRINAISAGPLKTLASSGISDFKQIFNHIEEHAPLRRNVTTEDVGKAAVFLASDLGSAVTGEIMFVDCGYNNLGI